MLSNVGHKLTVCTTLANNMLVEFRINGELDVSESSEQVLDEAVKLYLRAFYLFGRSVDLNLVLRVRNINVYLTIQSQFYLLQRILNNMTRHKRLQARECKSMAESIICEIRPASSSVHVLFEHLSKF